MKNINKYFYYLVSFLTIGLLASNKVLAAPSYNTSTSTSAAENSSNVGDLETWANSIIGNFLNIIYFLITIYVFWWAFNILTAWEDEEKVKKWKTIMIHAVAWFVVVYLTGSIVKFIFASITTTAGA